MISMKMLMLLLIAAASLNLTSYIFYSLSPPTRPSSLHYRPRATSKALVDFTAKLLCPDSMENAKTKNTDLGDDHSNNLAFSNKEIYTKFFMTTKSNNNIKICPEIPPDLGPVEQDSTLNCLKAFDKIYTDVQIGGSYTPSNCTARQSVAIIIPFRTSPRVNNRKHLGTFLYMLHPFLMKQQLEYQVFVVEQANPSQRFNHGKLLNTGFVEIQRRIMRGGKFQCIIIHEPYIIPVDIRNLYRCGRYPKQLAVNVERPDKFTYEPMFGGAVAIPTQQFIRVNGFSNIYWDNDSDYEDLYKRLLQARYFVNRSTPEIGKYKTLRNYDLPTIKKSTAAVTSSPINLIDGLTTVTYILNNFELKYIFTHINVTLEEDSAIETILSPKQILQTFSQ